MKTQISHLRLGVKNQILNLNIDYSELPKSTSLSNHSGSNKKDVDNVWNKVIEENPNEIDAIIKGVKVKLKSNWSTTGKSVTYRRSISKKNLKEKFGIIPSKANKPYISIQGASTIIVGNGKNSYRYVCPSLVSII